MRLGIAQWSYQYFLAQPGSPYFVDRGTFAYNYRGSGRPYFMSTPVHVSHATPSDATEWLVTRCGQLGVEVCHGNIMRWDDQAHLDRVRGLLDKYQLELIPSNGADMVCTGDQARRGQEDCIKGLERYARFGGVRLTKFNTPMTYNRFSKEMPVNEQLALIKENVRPIVKAAAELGIVLALENHYDYRAAEIREVIEAVDSPNLRSLLDVGSPFAVCEEPVEATRTLAPYAVHVHFKDCLVHPWTPASTAGYYSCQYAVPLGEGNVDLVQIVQILQENAPDPDRLCLALEIVPVPADQDEDLWVVESAKWCREHVAQHLSARSRGAAAATA
jgi:sugar phosphate isomerase/epimerase